MLSAGLVLIVRPVCTDVYGGQTLRILQRRIYRRPIFVKARHIGGGRCKPGISS